MVRGAVEAQVLQVRDEVRDRALVYALTLTEDVQLVEEHIQRNQHHFQHTDSLNNIRAAGRSIDCSASRQLDKMNHANLV